MHPSNGRGGGTFPNGWPSTSEERGGRNGVGEEKEEEEEEEEEEGDKEDEEEVVGDDTHVLTLQVQWSSDGGHEVLDVRVCCSVCLSSHCC